MLLDQFLAEKHEKISAFSPYAQILNGLCEFDEGKGLGDVLSKNEYLVSIIKPRLGAKYYSFFKALHKFGLPLTNYQGFNLSICCKSRFLYYERL